MRSESEQLSALTDSYASGDDVAFEPLYALLAPRLYRFCLRLTAKRADADECWWAAYARTASGRASVQLIEVATGYHRWSHRFEPTLGNVFAIQDEIAQNVASIVDPTRCQIRGAMAIGPTRDYPHSALD